MEVHLKVPGLHVLTFVALTGLAGSAARGQEGCQQAAQTAVANPLSLEGRAALSRLRLCGATGGQGFANVLNSHRMSTDTMLLEQITFFLRTFRDGNVFGTAAAVANDQNASPQARVFAFRVLHWALVPSLILQYGDLASPELLCFRVPSAILEGIRRGSAMPSNYVNTIKGVTQTVLADSAADPRVRSAARCVRSWENRPLITDENDPRWAVPAAPVNPYTITLSYVCGNQFRVRNTAPYGVTVTYRVVETPETGSVVVPAKDPVLGHADAFFTTQIQGFVVLRWMEKVVDNKPNGNIPCS
jgi:hypothetical protein